MQFDQCAAVIWGQIAHYIESIRLVFHHRSTDHHSEYYQIAAWLLRFAANLSLKDTADVFGMSPSRISHIQRMIESRRLTQREHKACGLCIIKQ